MVRVKLISKEFTKSEDGKLIKMVGCKVGSKAYARWGDEYTFTKESLVADTETWKYGGVTLNHQMRDKGVIMESKFEDPNAIMSLQIDNHQTIEMMNTKAFTGFSQECDIIEADETTSKDLLDKYKDNLWDLSGQRTYNIKRFQGEGMSILFYPVTPACTKEMGCDMISSIPKTGITMNGSFIASNNWSPWKQTISSDGTSIYTTSGIGSDNSINVLIVMSGIVPPNPSNKKADEDESWGGPSLGDFTNKYWADMSDAEKRNVAEHYAWTPKMPPEKFTDLKLPHHRPKDGAVVWRGVSAAMGALLGARGGIDIPEADKQKVYKHLTAHYKQFDKEPPTFINNNNGDNKLNDDEYNIKSKEGEEILTKEDELAQTIESKNKEIETLKAQLADKDKLIIEGQAKSSELESQLKTKDEELKSATDKIVARVLEDKNLIADEIISMGSKKKKEDLVAMSKDVLVLLRDEIKEVKPIASKQGAKFEVPASAQDKETARSEKLKNLYLGKDAKKEE